MQSNNTFYLEKLESLLKNLEQESGMIRIAFQNYYSGGNVENHLKGGLPSALPLSRA